MIYGWDIGGAHLKLAVWTAQGKVIAVQQRACPLWQGTDQLVNALTALLRERDQPARIHAVTMTGELCDLFASRTEGVNAILDVIASQLVGRIVVYAGGQGWLTIEQARLAPLQVASMNWHATAALIARDAPNALIVDVGSTTTDLLPIVAGRVAVRGMSDRPRLDYGELVYTGVCRTPVMAVCRGVPWQGNWRPLAAEYFATMADVYRLTGELPNDVDLYPTADGRAADALHSAARLGRMLCEDVGVDDLSSAVTCARYVRWQQLNQIQAAYALQQSSLTPSASVFVGAGAGEFLARRLASVNDVPYRSFGEIIGVKSELMMQAAICAPAVAVARLAADLT